jgi:uncharacterized protein
LIKLDLGSTPDGFSHVDMIAEASELDVSLDGGRLESPVELSLDVNRRGDDIFLKGRASVKVVLECARCLEEYSHLLESPIELLCLIGGEPGEVDGCGDREDVIEVRSGTKYVDLAGYIRSELLVLVPLKPLCDEGCRGLCPKCGANLNISPCSCHRESHDSRWDALKKLK